ncbi:hypothetical protein BDN70DRAFT_939555 [Pholiota conissans]|uniref:Uncharacterized protein n=1 Tax=Pholiota conissans TaxID=109636 RepID=A0A9P5YJU2_9AGAR|nr:hypothetical protein BDN70DRAFT_939555 [Pholiota conissans]
MDFFASHMGFGPCPCSPVLPYTPMYPDHTSVGHSDITIPAATDTELAHFQWTRIPVTRATGEHYGHFMAEPTGVEGHDLFPAEFIPLPSPSTASSHESSPVQFNGYPLFRMSRQWGSPNMDTFDTGNTSITAISQSNSEAAEINFKAGLSLETHVFATQNLPGSTFPIEPPLDQSVLEALVDNRASALPPASHHGHLGQLGLDLAWSTASIPYWQALQAPKKFFSKYCSAGNATAKECASIMRKHPHMFGVMKMKVPPREVGTGTGAPSRRNKGTNVKKARQSAPYSLEGRSRKENGKKKTMKSSNPQERIETLTKDLDLVAKTSKFRRSSHRAVERMGKTFEKRIVNPN